MPQENTTELENAEELTIPAKRSRRTAKLLNLGGCDTCQKPINDAEKSNSSLVAECSNFQERM